MEIVEGALNDRSVRRLAGHISGTPHHLQHPRLTHSYPFPASFEFWYPDTAELYHEVMVKLGFADTAEVQLQNHIFPDSFFCATTMNLGPQTSTKPHRDSKNLVGGICALLVLGDFDHTRSGHLILHELKVILELKQGDLVFFPSAGITHSNSSLRAGETRYSMVQYTAGQLFNYRLPGTAKNSRANADVGQKRWQECLSYLGTAQDVLDAAAKGGRSLRSSGVRGVVNSGRSNVLAPRASF